MSDEREALLGLGTNLGDRLGTLRSAVRVLEASPGVTLIGCSGVYESPPLGPVEQDDYLNAVVLVRTSLALRELLTLAHAVSRLEDGVYLSVGSAVMSPMIFEKSFAMAQNLGSQQGRTIERHYILVVDLAEADWDWNAQGEPPASHPAYYQRFCKTFSRMGGTMRYLAADNRDFFLALVCELTAS